MTEAQNTAQAQADTDATKETSATQFVIDVVIGTATQGGEWLSTTSQKALQEAFLSGSATVSDAVGKAAIAVPLATMTLVKYGMKHGVDAYQIHVAVESGDPNNVAKAVVSAVAGGIATAAAAGLAVLIVPSATALGVVGVGVLASLTVGNIVGVYADAYWDEHLRSTAAGQWSLVKISELLDLSIKISPLEPGATAAPPSLPPADLAASAAVVLDASDGQLKLIANPSASHTQEAETQAAFQSLLAGLYGNFNLEPRISALLEQTKAFSHSASGEFRFDHLQGADAVRALSKGLTVTGLGLAAYDMVTSNEKALAQYHNGDHAGALSTESAMLGRLLGGFWGAEIGAGALLVLAAALAPPVAGGMVVSELTLLAAGLIGAYLGMEAGEQAMAAAQATGNALGEALVQALSGQLSGPLGEAINTLLARLPSPLLQRFSDPLILDLDDDGIELFSIQDAVVHFDFDLDGFAERAGWVRPDDALLAIDANQNGKIDGIHELFGTPLEDGFIGLERLDSNQDGKIDANDTAYAALRLWRDQNSDGIAAEAEVQTLTEAGVQSISLSRSKAEGLLAGHQRGFRGSYTTADGQQHRAETIYFQTDRKDTRPILPDDFTPADGINALPALSGSGQLHSSAYALSTSPELRTRWTQLADQAGKITAAELDQAFDSLLLQWAGVHSLAPASRGAYVNAQHLAFVETFFGESYRRLNPRGEVIASQPNNTSAGQLVETSYSQIKDLMKLSFLSQVSASELARHGTLDLANPFFLYPLLPSSSEGLAAASGKLETWFKLSKSLIPAEFDAAMRYLQSMVSGLDGVKPLAFAAQPDSYRSTVSALLSDLSPALRALGLAILNHQPVLMGSHSNDSLTGQATTELLYGARGDDQLAGKQQNDSYLYARGDGHDSIRDGNHAGSADRLLFSGIKPAEVSLLRQGNDLTLVIAESQPGANDQGSIKIIGTLDHYFNAGVEQIVFADGSSWSQADLRLMLLAQASSDGDDTLVGFNTADTLRGGKGNDSLAGGYGNDTYLYARGDGHDSIRDRNHSGNADRLLLSDISPAEVSLLRQGNDLTLVIAESQPGANDQGSIKIIGTLDHYFDAGVEQIGFADGSSWSQADLRLMLLAQASSDGDDTLVGFNTADTLRGGKGNDSLAGGYGNDTYLYARGDGHDSIRDGNHSGSTDRLLLSDISPAEVSLLRQGNDLTLVIAESQPGANDQGSIKIKDTLEPRYNTGIEQIVFADGSSWSQAEVLQKLLTPAVAETHWI